MKRIFISLFSLIGFLAISQNTSVSIGSGHSFNIMADDTPAVVSGTMYYNDSFSQARIDNSPEVVFLRYNAFRDEMEYKQGTDTYYLIKDDNIRVDFFNNKKLYQYLKYSDVDKTEKRGFLLEIVGGEKSLYKSEKISLIPERLTTTGYETPKPAEYRKTKENYYIKNGELTVAFPKNKKELLKMFPDKNTEISNFLKKNKPSFSKETDLIELTKFLNNI